MRVNLTLIIPAYKRYENIYRLLCYFSINKVVFNQIIILHDKIEENTDSSIVMYEIKIRNDFHNIKHVINDKRHGIASILLMCNYTVDDERYLLLEDDLWVNVSLFDQIDSFFDSYYSDEVPVFVGYSCTLNHTNQFFKTYSCMPLWGIVTLGKYLRQFLLYYDRCIGGSWADRYTVIDKVISFNFDCPVFERYKADFFKQNRTSVELKLYNLDFYVNLYLIASNRGVLKNNTSHVVRRDFRFSTNNPTSFTASHGDYCDTEHDMINGLLMWR